MQPAKQPAAGVATQRKGGGQGGVAVAGNGVSDVHSLAWPDDCQATLTAHN